LLPKKSHAVPLKGGVIVVAVYIVT
jgi:hypothetical protein